MSSGGDADCETIRKDWADLSARPSQRHDEYDVLMSVTSQLR